jgi:DNA modification methylase
MADHRSESAPEAPTARDRAWTIRQGDCLRILPQLPEASVDAVICDPPYAISFCGHSWDGSAIHHAVAATTPERPRTPGEAYQAWTELWARESLRVLKPGGHLVAFGAPRTFHRLSCGIENAGVQLRDMLIWLYGTGLPKSRRLAGGRGTALKPAYEPILLARKQPDGAVEANIQRHGLGALNIDACRTGGRWPANVLLSHHRRCTTARCRSQCPARIIDKSAISTRDGRQPISRLFYCTKASRRERDAGCERLPRRTLDLLPNAHHGKHPGPAANNHPTVKPLALMRWLIRLCSPQGGLVLDPFAGSGTTGAAAVLEHRRFLGIERDPEYADVARARIAHWAAQAADTEARS